MSTKVSLWVTLNRNKPGGCHQAKTIKEKAMAQSEKMTRKDYLIWGGVIFVAIVATVYCTTYIFAVSSPVEKIFDVGLLDSIVIDKWGSDTSSIKTTIGAFQVKGHASGFFNSTVTIKYRPNSFDWLCIEATCFKMKRDININDLSAKAKSELTLPWAKG